MKMAGKANFLPEVVLVVTKSEKGEVDITPIGWARMGSSYPKTWAIALTKRQNAYKSIIKTKEFAICISSIAINNGSIFCCKNVNEYSKKLRGFQFSLLESEKIKAPIVEELPESYECKLLDYLADSDSTIFLGEVVKSHKEGR